jgi:hypothetical protein
MMSVSPPGQTVQGRGVLARGYAASALRFQSGWLDLNQRSPAPDAGGLDQALPRTGGVRRRRHRVPLASEGKTRGSGGRFARRGAFPALGEKTKQSGDARRTPKYRRFRPFFSGGALSRKEKRAGDLWSAASIAALVSLSKKSKAASSRRTSQAPTNPDRVLRPGRRSTSAPTTRKWHASVSGC